MDGIQQLNDKISVFKRKLLQTLAFKSISFFLLSFTSAFLFATYLEYFLYLPVVIKSVIVLGGAAAFLYLLTTLVILPARRWLAYNRFMSDENAAQKIGSYFPEIRDKLLNTVQLRNQISDQNTLAAVSLSQRAGLFSSFNFTEAAEKEQNRKLYYLAFLPFILLIITYLYNQNVIFDSSERLLHFNRAYQPPAPFEIRVLNPALEGFRSEPFDISFEVTGDYASDQVYLIIDGVRKKVTESDGTEYQFHIPKLNKETNFKIEMAGYTTSDYRIDVLDRPAFSKGSITLRFPDYLNRKSETKDNLSNLTVPEGTSVTWNIETKNTDEIFFALDSARQSAENEDDGRYRFSTDIRKSTTYSLRLKNANGLSKNDVQYHVDVVQDAHPQIDMSVYEDTSLYSYIMINGNIADDYGFSSLKLQYRLGDGPFQSISLPVVKKQPNQTYLYHWKLEDLLRSPDEKLEYYVQVWDNDGVNGPKSARAQMRSFSLPNREAAKERIAKKSDEVENNMEETLRKLKERDKELEELEESLKAKKKLTWQDKKAVEQEVKKQQALQKELEQLNEQFKDLKKNQEKFENQSESLKEKAEALDELMEKLMDEETKKLMEELQKLLEESEPNEQSIKNMMEQLKKEDFNLEKELERALEMMKQLKLDQKLEKAAQELEELSKEQEKLSEETEQKTENNEDLLKKQEGIEKRFDDIKKDIKEADEMNKELNEEDEKFENETLEEQQEIDNQINDSKQSLQKNQNNKSGKSQKKASEQMKQMSDQLKEMSMQGEMEQMEEDMQMLRQILENLVQLSFDQESLQNDFKSIRSVNPQFVEKSTAQIKIKDDSKIIEDSLLELAKRNFQIESFVTDKLFEMNDKVDKSLEAIRDRDVRNITVNQQLAMTAMNDLALMLSDVAEQMQQQMSQQMPGMQQCSKPGGKKPNGKKLSQMQKELNEQIGSLKKSGKQGKELSEELARLAAQQEMIRQQMKEMEKGGQQPGDGKLEKLMEETEKDLVNKRLLNLNLARQEEIVTRLLQSEKAQRERELDEMREAEKAKQKENGPPDAFDEYLREKEKQLELLKTISPAYSPYYKKKIKEYFESETP